MGFTLEIFLMKCHFYVSTDALKMFEINLKYLLFYSINFILQMALFNVLG